MLLESFNAKKRLDLNLEALETLNFFFFFFFSLELTNVMPNFCYSTGFGID
jgi:hypothetical protein